MDPVKGLISEFLIALSTNDDVRRRYSDESLRPELYAEFELNEDQREILESRDLKSIRGAILEEYLRAKVDVALYVQHVAAPPCTGPDDTGDVSG